MSAWFTARKRFVGLLVFACLVAAGGTFVVDAQQRAGGQAALTGADAVRAAYTKFEEHGPDARRREAVHRRSTSRRTPPGPTRSCSRGRRTASAPYGVDQYRASLGPSRAVPGKTATSSSTRTCAAGTCREGEFVQVGPHKPDKSGPKDIDESTDTYDTIEWLREARPGQQRQGRHVGHLAARLLRRRRR